MRKNIQKQVKNKSLHSDFLKSLPKQSKLQTKKKKSLKKSISEKNTNSKRFIQQNKIKEVDLLI